MSTRVLLIDFSWIFNKIYYAQKYLHPQDVASAHVRGVIGLFDTFNKTIFTRYNKIYIVLDCKTERTRGRSINEDYKKGRPNHDNVYKYLELVAGALANIPKVLVVQNRNREADEIISYLCHKYNNNYVDIYSGDKDLIQLTQSVNVNITDTYKQGAFTFLTEQDIFKKFKNSKKEDFTRISNNIGDIIKYRVLRGDTSDNLPPLFPRIRDTQIKEIIIAWEGNILDEEVFKKILKSIEDTTLRDKVSESKSTLFNNYKIMNLTLVKNDDIIKKDTVRYKPSKKLLQFIQIKGISWLPN